MSYTQYVKLIKIRAVLTEAQSLPLTHLSLEPCPMCQPPRVFVLWTPWLYHVVCVNDFQVCHLLPSAVCYFLQVRFLSSSIILQKTHKGHPTHTALKACL